MTELLNKIEELREIYPDYSLCEMLHSAARVEGYDNLNRVIPDNDLLNGINYMIELKRLKRKSLEDEKK